MTPTEAIRRACELAGGQSALARKLVELHPDPDKKLTSQAVSHWCRDDGNGVPGDWALYVETAVDCQVTRQELRPNLYPETAGV